MELHGSVYIQKCRSRAGADCHPRKPAPVVLGLGSGILLSSVFRVSALEHYLPVFRCLSILRDLTEYSEDLARLSQ